MLLMDTSWKVTSGEDAYARGGGDGVHGLGGEGDAVPRHVGCLALGKGEHFRRSGDIEQVDALEEDDDDESFDGAHGVSAWSATAMSGSACWMTLPTLSDGP